MRADNCCIYINIFPYLIKGFLNLDVLKLCSVNAMCMKTSGISRIKYSRIHNETSAAYSMITERQKT
jgi:hypothetical protein